MTESTNTEGLNADELRALLATAEADLETAQGRAEFLADVLHEVAAIKGEARRPLDWEAGYSEGLWTRPITWRDDKRVKVTPTHFEIEIYNWAPSPNEGRRQLEAENADNAPPNKIRLRRFITVGDAMSISEYPEAVGEKATTLTQSVAMGCVLSADIGDKFNRLNFDMITRASYEDWQVLEAALSDIRMGKGMNAVARGSGT